MTQSTYRQCIEQYQANDNCDFGMFNPSCEHTGRWDKRVGSHLSLLYNIVRIWTRKACTF